MSSYRPLHTGWTVALAGSDGPAPGAVARRHQPVPATVPGCVHTDLLAAGLIPDPYLDDNEHRVSWIGRADWRYETSLDWQPEIAGGQVDLVCAGLDTVATVELNGEQVARTANMHRSYRFPVTDLLRSGENRLAIQFESAYRYAEAVRDQLGDRPSAYDPEPFPFIRKNACNFGWDWGPTLVTAGIWRAIGLHSWHTARLGQVRPVITVDRSDGRVDVHVEVVRADPAGDTPLTVTATVGEAGGGSTAASGGSTVASGEVTVASGECTASITVTVPDPALWWPRGYGEQARYRLQVRLQAADGAELDHWSRLIGFRSVRLDTTPDQHGTPYTLVVNDVPVFARGVNWIPDDVFVSRVDRQRYATRLDQARAANVNLLRIWGGGIYESDEFYDLCDERGLLVMQDFLFSCAAYPEEQPIYDEVAAEARDNVVRLASHPSLVLWHGNNENIWGWHDWDWQPLLGGRTWGAGYYFDLLPKIVAELDPTRPYWPGSPYSGSRDVHPNEPAHGSMHIWTVWNAEDYTTYRDHAPRFVAEFGWQAPPSFATLRRALSDDPLAPDSPGMRHHQKAADGNGKLQRGLERHFGEPASRSGRLGGELASRSGALGGELASGRSGSHGPVPQGFDDWHWLMQLNQARAVSVGVEHFRSLYPTCMGAVVWQLNDCWPVTSWAAVDGDARRKPLWYALRRVFADRLLTIQPRGEGLVLVAVNDSAAAWSETVAVSRRGLDGRLLAEAELPVAVRPRTAVTMPLPALLAVPADERAELLLAEAGDLRGWWFFARDRDLAYPKAEYEAVVEPVPGGARVWVTAGTLLRELTLFPDRLDPGAEVDEALITLLPGESTTFTVTAGSALDPQALTTPPVLRCVNDRLT